LFILQFVVAVLSALGCFESHLRALPTYDWIAPKYAAWDWGRAGIWFDIGLFTDPPMAALAVRSAIIFAIGCTVYTLWSLISRAVRHRQARQYSPMESTHIRLSPFKEPGMARIVQWTLVVVDGFLLLRSCLLPMFPRIY
jgi:hypothetical protein